MPDEMPLFATPNFLLLDGTRRIGPEVTTPDSGPSCTSLYGFSSRARYETFQANCRVKLKPYPLVMVFLREECESSDDDLKLVILESAQPDEPTLYAALITTVLKARESRAQHLTPDYTLAFDPKSCSYTLNGNSP